MGVYIKGMEMPKKGYRLILIHADGTVQSTDGETTAVPVPPHGDLVERQAVLNTFLIHMNRTLHFVTIRDTIPIIIPAEGGET